MSPAKIKTILLVEDDPDQIKMYGDSLEREGYKVIAARNNKDGFALTKKDKPDLVFLDLLLGGESGLEFLKELKKEKETKNIKVVVFSNYYRTGIDKECKSLGALDYILKDNFIPSQIAKKVKDYLK